MAPSLSGKIEAGFRVILCRGPRLLLRRPYYEPLLWFMIKVFEIIPSPYIFVTTDMFGITSYILWI